MYCFQFALNLIYFTKNVKYAFFVWKNSRYVCIGILIGDMSKKTQCQILDQHDFQCEIFHIFIWYHSEMLKINIFLTIVDLLKSMYFLINLTSFDNSTTHLKFNGWHKILLPATESALFNLLYHVCAKLRLFWNVDQNL